MLSSAMALFRFEVGSTPLVVSAPHVGTQVPAEIGARLSEAARGLPDTDWHVDRLYASARALGATTLFANLSRYVVDLNRDPSGKPLYPGADNTEICPTRSFDGEAIYVGAPPEAVEVAERIERYWRPYHERLRAALEETRARHGIAVLLDAHSIRSVLPRFFAGRLPDFNFGTADGASCAPALSDRLYAALEAPGFSRVRDGRFKGGYITRAYGRPADGVHAAQLELAQSAYMEERPPWAWREDLAARVAPAIGRMLEAALSWAREKS
jgi:N-formylglutamate deformylase